MVAQSLMKKKPSDIFGKPYLLFVAVAGLPNILVKTRSFITQVGIFTAVVAMNLL